ncbi:ABC transporter permease [Caldicellulosiruptor naganoensis]|uniref:ABC transporter permease n=1 Tax=Caldicellulosiruptor naganoensis TaxID=29324 RepID=A0ABY7BID1_9FIRM|nr:ABC transporter permease [Caldicellulosiruptor naganoensis]WAM31341.1 ABC transporter permease [Caldicellulosiruptor naganoensis]
MSAVLKKELKIYFSTPTGYIFMGFFLLISGFFFAVSNLFPASPNYTLVLGNITFIFLVVVPVLTMRLLSEEARTKTDQLLLTSPLKLTEIVLGKYLAAVTVFVITIAVTVLYPTILSFYGDIPVAETLGAYIGFFLLGCSFISIGLFISSLTDNQFIAAVVTFSALLLTWVIDWLESALPTDRVAGFIFVLILVGLVCAWIYLTIRNIIISVSAAAIGAGAFVAVYILKPEFYDNAIVRFFKWFSLLSRYQKFTNGLLDLSSIAYYLSFIFVFIFLTIRVLEKRRWS